MGKMIILLVLGSYFILGSIMRNNNNISTDTVQNVVDYYTRSNTKHIAGSGANMAVGNIIRNKSWNIGYKNLAFSSGTLNLNVSEDLSLGPAGVRILSVGTFMGYQDSVIVEMNLAAFNKYVWFTDEFSSNGWFITGHIFDGPFHSNQKINISGSPIFKGKVTMGEGPIKLSSWYAPPDPQFLGGYEYGVNINMPGSLNGMQKIAEDGGFFSKEELWMTFNGDNTVSYRTSLLGKDSTIELSALAPNSLIYSEKDIHIKGKIDGSVTVSTKENVWIDDDIGVVDDPRTNPASNQFLGLCAEKKVIITENIPNITDCEIVAAIYAGDKLEAQNYSKRPPSGKLRIFGSRTQKKAGFIGSKKSGFISENVFDPRFYTDAPPHYPLTDRMQILSWWE